jgi:hypothetical protein
MSKPGCSNNGQLSCCYALTLENQNGSFLFSLDRIIFSVCASSNESKKKQAIYMLVDEQIKKYANKYKWFDFSGSNLPGVAYFNSTFSALLVKYYSLRIIKLPKIAKVFIKN